MSSDNLATTGPAPEILPAETLGKWVATLADDALRLAEVSLQFAPGAPLRAPFRAGLRHLLHIVPLSQGIEALAMLEVSIMLRVTALLATPAEELDSETVIRLRGDTPLIEELFPEEKEVIWQFCHALIEAERRLPSEQSVPAAIDAVALPGSGETPETGGATSRVAGSDSGAPDAWGVASTAAEPGGMVAHDAENPEGASNSEGAATGDAAANRAPDADDAALAASPDAAPEPGAADAHDELLTRLRSWASGYRAPQFGGKPYDLTRARAFVRTRVNAWAGQ